jgi:hypothetical protein
MPGKTKKSATGKKKVKRKSKSKKVNMKIISAATAQALHNIQKRWAGYGVDGVPRPSTLYATGADMKGPPNAVAEQLVYFHICQVNWEYQRMALVLPAKTSVLRLKYEIANRLHNGALEANDIIILKRTNMRPMESKTPSLQPLAADAKPLSIAGKIAKQGALPEEREAVLTGNFKKITLEDIANNLRSSSRQQIQSSSSQIDLAQSDASQMSNGSLANLPTTSSQLPSSQRPSSFAHPSPPPLYNFHNPERKVSTYDHHRLSTPHLEFPFRVPKTTLCNEPTETLADCFPDLMEVLQSKVTPFRRIPTPSPEDGDSSASGKKGRSKKKKKKKKGGKKTVEGGSKEKKGRKKRLSKAEQRKAKAQLKAEKIKSIVQQYKYDPAVHDLLVYKMAPAQSLTPQKPTLFKYDDPAKALGSQVSVQTIKSDVPSSAKAILPATILPAEEGLNLPTFTRKELLLRVKRDYDEDIPLQHLDGPHLPNSPYLHYLLLPRPGISRLPVSVQPDAFGGPTPFEQTLIPLDRPVSHLLAQQGTKEPIKDKANILESPKHEFGAKRQISWFHRKLAERHISSSFEHRLYQKQQLRKKSLTGGAAIQRQMVQKQDLKPLFTPVRERKQITNPPLTHSPPSLPADSSPSSFPTTYASPVPISSPVKASNFDAAAPNPLRHSLLTATTSSPTAQSNKDLKEGASDAEFWKTLPKYVIFYDIKLNSIPMERTIPRHSIAAMTRAIDSLTV